MCYPHTVQSTETATAIVNADDLTLRDSRKAHNGGKFNGLQAALMALIDKWLFEQEQLVAHQEA